MTSEYTRVPVDAMAQPEETKYVPSWTIAMEKIKKDDKDRARRIVEKQKKEKARAKKLEKASVGKASVGDQKNGVSKIAGEVINEDEDDDLDTRRAPRELGINELIKKAKETFTKNKARRENGEVARRTEAARAEIRLELEKEQRAYLASVVHKEAIAQLKNELRAQAMEELKAEIYEQGVKDFLAINEEKMKKQLEKHLLAHLTEYLPAQLAVELKPEIEQKLRRELEGEVRAQLMSELPAKLAPKIEALKPKIEERLRKELSAKLEEDQRARADLKRASPDDDFPRDNKRRRSSYDYDGEHSGDHEDRVASVLERAFPSAHDDLPDYEDVVGAEEEGPAATKEKGEDGPPAPNEDEIFDIRAYHRQQALKRGRPVEEDEEGDDDDFEIRKKLVDDFWASMDSPPPSSSPSATPSASPSLIDEGRMNDNGVEYWEDVDGELEWASAEDLETTDWEENEEEEEEEDGEGVEVRGSSKEDAILLDSDPE